MITTATVQELNEALNRVNEQFDNNIRFKRIEQKTAKRVQFTLTINDSSKPGARRSRTGRKIAAACWHVHGHFFDHLFDIRPDILVISQGARITAQAGNWQDKNIGSSYYPFYYSEACEC